MDRLEPVALRRLSRLALLALGILLPATPLQASSDISCEPSWSIAPVAACENRILLTPTNDSRVNLLLLLRDQVPDKAEPTTYPKADYPGQAFGNTFFDWPRLVAGYWPDGGDGITSAAGNGSICDSLTSGDEAFAAALAANSAVPADERGKLSAARGRLKATCEAAEGTRAEWPTGIASPSGKAFLAYLQAAEAFYAAQWATARTGFVGLAAAAPKGRAKAADPWVAEAALYMVARSDLNAAMAGAFDQYGDFAGPAKVDQSAVARARAGLAAYLAAYPRGAWADSARGLVRRAFWLAGDTRGLAQLYGTALSDLAPGSIAAVNLVQEIDSKLLFADGAGAAIDSPALLAAWDLVQMRQADYDLGGTPSPRDRVLTAAELAAQEPRFAARPDLFRYLQAYHAFAIQRDMAKVLQLIPDAARARAFTPLAFSAQLLRGQALAARRDPAEAGFWRDLLGGASRLWQRPTVELALALNYERQGKLAAVFAPESPIRDMPLRQVLLMHSASPALLRLTALSAGRPQHERDLALFTLLYKQLSRGDYAGFLANRALVPAGASREGGLWDLAVAETIPLGLFAGAVGSSGDMACPALGETVAALKHSPQDHGALLCLGEFWRLNGFDGFTQLDKSPPKDELGGAASLFPGVPLTRGMIYARIIADKSARPDDKAYALYRAVNCYGPSGYNNCGGVDVGPGVRRTWFNQLKRDYPKSVWARTLRYYW